MGKVYDVNEGVEVTLTFKDRDGELRDPVAWTFEKYSPSGVKTTIVDGAAPLVHVSEGVFTYDLIFTEKGTWFLKATCSDSTAPVVGEFEYFVRAPRFT